MTVSELKAILEGIDDDFEVRISTTVRKGKNPNAYREIDRMHLSKTDGQTPTFSTLHMFTTNQFRWMVLRERGDFVLFFEPEANVQEVGP